MGEDGSRRQAQIGDGVSGKITKRPARAATGRPPSRSAPAPGSRRKLVEFDAETWHALHLLGRDSLKSVQELAEEAFADLLKKHRRPVTLKQALRESAPS